jgi:hypothetical protein
MRRVFDFTGVSDKIQYRDPIPPYTPDTRMMGGPDNDLRIVMCDIVGDTTHTLGLYDEPEGPKARRLCRHSEATSSGIHKSVQCHQARDSWPITAGEFQVAWEAADEWVGGKRVSGEDRVL